MRPGNLALVSKAKPSAIRVLDGAFENAVAEAETIHGEVGLRPFMRRLLARYDLKHAVYHGVVLPSAPKPDRVLVLTYPRQTIDRYIERAAFSADPLVAATARSILPVDWATLAGRGPRTRRLFGEEAELTFGRQGLTFPVRGAAGDYALLSISLDRSDVDWEKLKWSYMRDFQVLAHLVHGKVLEFEQSASILPSKPLSPRERECLAWAARGKTNKEIAQQLSISERVVRAYFESARHKLNCLNRGHVLSRALSLRIIEPNFG